MFDFADLPTVYRWAIALWLAALGGCIGSFLNVVVYRLPAGKSLVRPGSFCPKCGHPIRWHDNVPVFGWLALGGKCRDCREPISFRYPLVEAITAALFFGLGWVELLSGGANLPPLEIFMGVKKQVLHPDMSATQLAGVFAYHLLLLGTLLPAALITYDGHRLPRKLFFPAILIGAVAPLIWPYLHPGLIQGDLPGLQAWLYDVVHCAVAGVAVGWILGWFLPRSTNREDVTSARISPTESEDQQASHAGTTSGRAWNPAVEDILLVALCVSLFLAGEAMLLIGGTVAVLLLLERAAQRLRPGLRVVGPVIWLALLVPVWLVFWRQIAALCPLVS